MKKARQKAGRLVHGLLPSSRSQSPAPLDPDPSVILSTPLPREHHTESGTQPKQTVEEPTAFRQSSHIVGASQSTPLDRDPIPPAPPLDRLIHADPQAGLVAAEERPDKSLEMVRLASSPSPGPPIHLVRIPNLQMTRIVLRYTQAILN